MKVLIQKDKKKINREKKTKKTRDYNLNKGKNFCLNVELFFCVTGFYSDGEMKDMIVFLFTRERYHKYLHE